MTREEKTGVDIHLQRACDPTDLGETECIICELNFMAESVWGVTNDIDGQPVCQACIEYFGKRNPEKFPSIEEYEAAKQRFPEPIIASKEELVSEDPWWTYVNSVMYIERA
ncbi:MAG: hypothetical protein QOI57_2731 [Rubrobacteraceae bacterium]|nr:hypothetical protein [Rubrobacteraceae bacterium]